MVCFVLFLSFALQCAFASQIPLVAIDQTKDVVIDGDDDSTAAAPLVDSDFYNQGEDDEDDSAYWNCRRNPTWNVHGATRSQCQELTEWEPLGDYLDDTSLMESGSPVLIQVCLESAMEHHPLAFCNIPNATGHPACELKGLSLASRFQSDRDGELAILENILTEQEAFGIHALSDCVKKYLNATKYSEFSFERVFETEHPSQVGLFKFGGNYCTFLSGLLQYYLPGVASSLQAAIRTAYHGLDWGTNYEAMDPQELGLRTAEYLEYQNTGRLGSHVDQESQFSMSIALSEPTDYEGGYFRLEELTTLFKVNRLSGIVFFSEVLHGVTPVESGKRNVFVAEYWDRQDVPIGLGRPEHDEMDDYIEGVEGEGCWGSIKSKSLLGALRCIKLALINKS